MDSKDLFFLGDKAHCSSGRGEKGPTGFYENLLEELVAMDHDVLKFFKGAKPDENEELMEWAVFELGKDSPFYNFLLLFIDRIPRLR